MAVAPIITDAMAASGVDTGNTHPWTWSENRWDGGDFVTNHHTREERTIRLTMEFGRIDLLVLDRYILSYKVSFDGGTPVQVIAAAIKAAAEVAA